MTTYYIGPLILRNPQPSPNAMVDGMRTMAENTHIMYQVHCKEYLVPVAKTVLTTPTIVDVA